MKEEEKNQIEKKERLYSEKSIRSRYKKENPDID